MADAGRQEVQVAHDLAWALALLLLVGPVLVVLLGWLPLRLRWIRRASAAVGLRDGTAGRDLLALRALANQPLRRLVAIDADPVGSRRSGDSSPVDAPAPPQLQPPGRPPPP